MLPAVLGLRLNPAMGGGQSHQDGTGVGFRGTVEQSWSLGCGGWQGGKDPISTRPTPQHTPPSQEALGLPPKQENGIEAQAHLGAGRKKMDFAFLLGAVIKGGSWSGPQGLQPSGR